MKEKYTPDFWVTREGTISSPEAAALLATESDLLAALEGLLDHYEDLVHSSGCGFWDSSTEDVVIKAQAAIAKAKGEKP